jgi:adenylylsulfate kinase
MTTDVREVRKPASRPRGRRAADGPARPPVYIVGCPGSGTDMLARMLGGQAGDAAGAGLETARLAARTGARIVHLVRDGRDVAATDIPAGGSAQGAAPTAAWAEDPVSTAALCWEWHVRHAREAGARLGPGRYHEVRYEDLLRWPEPTCAWLCARLDLPFRRAVVGRESDGAGARAAMGPAELARWEATAGALLDELGYARAAPPPDPAAIVRAAELRQAFPGRPLPARWGGAPPLREGRTIWLTGLSGAGKSTVARIVERELRARGTRVEVVDGDIVRRNLCHGLGFSKEDRDTNIRRIAFVADLLSRNGVTVITAAISPYRAVRDEARALMGDRFVEVHVKASVAACAERDVKGLYAKALAGEIAHFTGVSDPYEPPRAPELVLATEHESPEESAARVLAFLDGRDGA